MSRFVIIILLLSTGAFCLVDKDEAEKVLKQDIKHDATDENPVSNAPLVNTEKSSADAPATEKTPVETPQKPRVTLDKEQINLLAEKVIRIHGVDPDGTDDENLENIAKLRNLVTNVKQDLNEKLILSQQKKKLNSNNQDVVKDSTPRASTDTVQGENEKHVPENDIKKNINDKGDVNAAIDIKENVNTLDDMNNIKTASEIENRASENESDNVAPENNLVDDVTTDKNEDTDNANSEDETIQQETAKKNSNEKLQTSHEATDSIPEAIKIEVESSLNAKEDISDKDAEGSVEPLDTVESVTVEKVTNATEAPIEEKNVEETEEDITDNDDVTNATNNDVNETVNEDAVEEENDNVKSIEEDEIIDTCSLGEDCEERDTTHKYSEEYNSEKTEEEKLENIIEDSYLQSIIKYVTSILN